MTRAIFLDRDGTILKLNGYITNAAKIEFFPWTFEAIRKINTAGYLCIIITNQPAIAQGRMTRQELEDIHMVLYQLARAQGGAEIDAFYYCPHHPEKGWPGEIDYLKIQCACRKPRPGMIINAGMEYNIDLSQSWMIGDSDCDIVAGKAAGCKTMQITKEHNLLDCVNLILGEEK